jgi:hypothetical protein
MMKNQRKPVFKQKRGKEENMSAASAFSVIHLNRKTWNGLKLKYKKEILTGRKRWNHEKSKKTCF